MEWTNQHILNLTEIDDQHENFVFLFSTLIEIMKRGKDIESTDDAVLSLIDFATFHFAFEETAMQKAEFPGFKEHKKEHKYFFDAIYNFHNILIKQNTTPSIEVLISLKDWFLAHIITSDKKFVPYLIGKNID